MLDTAHDGERLSDWASRNDIDLGDECPEIVGYWCRVAGVSLPYEAARRCWDDCETDEARISWREADQDVLRHHRLDRMFAYILRLLGW